MTLIVPTPTLVTPEIAEEMLVGNVENYRALRSPWIDNYARDMAAEWPWVST